MGVILALIATIFHAIACLVGAPLLSGVVNRVRAWMLGQRGPSLKQPYRHLARLLGKTSLVPDTATEMFTLWPLVAFVSLAVAILLIPGFCNGILTKSAGDYVTVIGLLALGRSAMMLGGLETGSAFGGAGVARLALRSLFTEAILLILLLVFAGWTQQTNLDSMVQTITGRPADLSIAMGLALAAMLMVAIHEVGTGPTGGQELVMAQQLVGLEYSGRHLALLDYASMLRLLVWMNLIICLFIPFGMAHANHILSWPLGLLLWGGKLGLLAVGLAIFEGSRAERRLSRVAGLLGMALFIALLASLFVVVTLKAGT